MKADHEDRLDAMLTTALVPPKLSTNFRASLARRLDEPRRSFISDALPDALHLAAGAVLTVFAAFAAPLATPVVAAIGIIATVGTYFLLAMLRNSFDELA
jgi:hypothetical protein